MGLTLSSVIGLPSASCAVESTIAKSVSWLASPAGMALALWLGLATTSAGYLLFGLGLPVLQPGHIATLTLLEPVGATLLAVLVLEESLPATG